MLNPLKWTTGPWQALLVLLLVVVSFLALTPRPLAGVESGLDKVAHLVAFTALAFLGYLGVPTRTALPFALLAYGGLIEVLQLFVPGRTAEWSRWDRYRGRYWLGSRGDSFRGTTPMNPSALP
jgi:VanZ family protein